MGFEAKVLADSVSPRGIRLTTFTVSYPRIIHAEMLRHRQFSRCAASSRAIPVERFIEQVLNEPYIPGEFCANKSGMQAGASLSTELQNKAQSAWLTDRDHAVQAARELLAVGVHKQWVNRLLEPFQWMTEVITATEWGNFDHLRIHEAAHPDIQRIARMMQEARYASTPTRLGHREWHLPLVSEEDREAFNDADPAALPLKERPLLSIGRVARVSYLRHEDESDVTKDIERAYKMMENGHMSPLEHAARPMTESELATTAMWRVKTSDGELQLLQASPDEPPDVGDTLGIYGGNPELHVTAVYDWKAFLGNYNGWVQYRKTLPSEEDRLAPTRA